MEVGVFFQAFVNAFIMVLLVGALIYWFIYFLIKIRKATKFGFKYKVLKNKHKEEDVALLMNYLDQGVTEENLLKELLLHTKLKRKKIDELLYIYREMQGGNKK